MTDFKRFDRFNDTELELIREALDSDDLWPYVYGTDPRRHFIGDATGKLASIFKRPQPSDLPFVVPTSSGTASIHVALAGLQIPAGTEVIVSPITDIGTITPILVQNLIPVFADVDPASGNISAQTIKEKIEETNPEKRKISAVIVVHLSGSPVDMKPIIQLCEPLGIKVIEDAAQALGAKQGRQRVGTFGDAGCFSLNSQKHITAGEGGFVLVHNETDFYRCHNFSDKHRDRFRGIRNVPKDGDEHSRYRGVGINYRMSELNGAMILAQVGKLKEIAKRRNRFGSVMDAILLEVAGIIPQSHIEDAYPSYFFHMFRTEKPIDDKTKNLIVREVNELIGEKLSIRFWKSYGNPIYSEPMFRNKNFFSQHPLADNAIWPAELVAQKIFSDPDYSQDYSSVRLPATEEYIGSSFTTYFDSGHNENHARLLCDAIIKVFKHYSII